MDRRTFLAVQTGIGLTVLGGSRFDRNGRTRRNLDLTASNPDLSVAYWQGQAEDVYRALTAAQLEDEIPIRLGTSKNMDPAQPVVDTAKMNGSGDVVVDTAVRVTLFALEPSTEVWAEHRVKDFSLFAHTVDPRLGLEIPEILLWHVHNADMLNAGASNQLIVTPTADFGVLLESSFDPSGADRYPLYFHTHSDQGGIPLRRGAYVIGLRHTSTGRLPDWSKCAFRAGDPDNMGDRKFLYRADGSGWQLVDFPYFVLLIE